MTVSTAEARDQLAELINRAAYGKERVILTRRGKKLVALVPVEDLELLEKLEDEGDRQDAKVAIAEAEENGAKSLGELKQDLGL